MSAFVGLPQFSTLNITEFKPKLKTLLAYNLEQINQLLQENHYYTWENLMDPLDDLDDNLEKMWAPFSHLHSVMDSKGLRDCYDQCLPMLSAYEAAIAHNHGLYEAIKSIDKSVLNDTQTKIITDNIQSFELSGVALSPGNKKRFEVIDQQLAELSNRFEMNVLDSAQDFTLKVEASRVVGLPNHALNTASELAAEQNLPGYLLNLETPCYQAVITYAEEGSLREEMYYAYVTRASDKGPSAGVYDNTPNMMEILALRHEKANLLGFNNYAELSLAQKMAESTDQVIDYLTHFIEKVQTQANTEMEDLKKFAVENYNIQTIQPWDVSFLSEKRRQKLFNLSQEDLRPYFPLPQVMQGLFDIVKKLYGMTMEEITGVDVWHKDVQCYCVVDKKNQVRGYIYTDLFARQNKRSGAWMDSLQSRRKLADGSVQSPIATLTCNFAKASSNQPAMLSHEEVITLFHEIGHCLHHVLTQVDYLGASGINGVEWDAVELPSQFFENWAWEQEALAFLTAHSETGEKLPAPLFKQLLAAKNFQSALTILRQMEFSLFDFRIHQEYSPDEAWQLTDILKEIRAKTALIPVAPYNRFQHSFSHIFAGGYSAGYYSYSWAEVLSSDAFARFEEEGVFNPKVGEEFLKYILEVGGSKPASEAYRSFRGREATVDALLRHNGII
ncbi:MAG: M3 family metallopeptidase [Legionella sp.]|nr:M3 family metallopeptidase [Legionella sp.]